MEANPYYLKDTDGGCYNKYPEFEVWEQGKKAGIREVVEWIRKANNSGDFYYSFDQSQLEAKLKEWGIE